MILKHISLVISVDDPIKFTMTDTEWKEQKTQYIRAYDIDKPLRRLKISKNDLGKNLSLISNNTTRITYDIFCLTEHSDDTILNMLNSVLSEIDNMVQDSASLQYKFQTIFNNISIETVKNHVHIN